MNDQKNMLLAIVLSAVVLIAWQIFFGMPQMEAQRQKQAQQQKQQEQTVPQPGSVPPVRPQPGSVPQPGSAPQPGVRPPARHRAAARSRHHPARAGPGQVPVPGQVATREAALAASPRVRIETPRLAGSVNLRGGRIDDLALTQYRETVDPKSPPVVLLAPSGAPMPFYAEFGWVPAAGTTAKLPDAESMWKQQGAGTLGVGRPVTLAFDNGAGLEFRRTIAVDDKYLFTVRDEIVNRSDAPVTLYPYALVSRHGTPKLEGFYILHEGLIGFLGDKGLKEETYADIEKNKSETVRGHQCLARHHRQILGGDAAARHLGKNSGPLPRGPLRHHQDLPDRLSAGAADHRSRARPALPMRACSPAPRRSRPSTATTRRSSSTASSS